MARKKSSGRKIEPAAMQMTFGFTIPAGSFSGTNPFLGHVDLSQCASLVNRRFYRQGINWCVNGFKFITQSAVFGNSASGSISITKLPQSWVLSNAWEKGFRAWQEMNKNATDESPSVKPKFLDFKIYANDLHHDAGFNANLLPISLGGAAPAASAGEWVSSKYVIPTAGAGVVSREVIATGASYPGASTATGLDAVSLIEGYAASRGLPNVLDPNTPDDAADASGPTPENWMTALFNEGIAQDEEVVLDLISENNKAPYPFENDGTEIDTMYPGGANQLSGLQIHDLSLISGTTIGGDTHLKGGKFPCGLIQLRGENYDITNDMIVTMIIDLVPGNHRGYLCEPMTDM